MRQVLSSSIVCSRNFGESKSWSTPLTTTDLSGGLLPRVPLPTHVLFLFGSQVLRCNSIQSALFLPVLPECHTRSMETASARPVYLCLRPRPRLSGFCPGLKEAWLLCVTRQLTSSASNQQSCKSNINAVINMQILQFSSDDSAEILFSVFPAGGPL